jgi:hypothetical protein
LLLFARTAGKEESFCSFDHPVDARLPFMLHANPSYAEIALFVVEQQLVPKLYINPIESGFSIFLVA